MGVELGAIIRRKRMERGLTQTKLAKRLDLSTSTVNGWEKGSRRPLITNVDGLTRELKLRKCQVIDLLLMEDQCPAQSIR